MIAPHYGSATVVRPQVVNVPELPGGLLSKCPYCWAQCWITRIEQTTPGARLFGGVVLTHTSACTRCAFNRGADQARMDLERWERENAEAAEWAASG